MYQVEDSFQLTSVDVKMIEEDPGIQPYGVGELIWGIVLLIGIFLVNISVLWVVSRSRELWKPRHLWMACLCVTDIFVGAHKALELLIFALPYRELCVLQRATLGIPYVINMLILSLLSLDRFIAVRYPFFYSSSISNKHVLIAFLIVLFMGSVITVISISLGLRDPICRTQSVQLVYLTVVLMICSVVTLFFNSSVLRIAKRQLNAIYAQQPLRKGQLGQRRVSVVCTNCGFKNETFVNTLLPLSLNPASSSHPSIGHKESVATNSPLIPPSGDPPPHPSLDPVVLGPLDLDLNLKGYDCSMDRGNGEANEETAHLNCDSMEGGNPHFMEVDETTAPLVRTISLPTIPDSMSMPISVIVQPDPSFPRPSVVIGNHAADAELGCRIVSMSNLESNEIPVTNNSDGTPATEFATSGIQPVSSHHLLPRSRSLMTCRTHQVMPHSTVPRLQLFRNLHFARTHMFHVGRLFPSIRFARTVLLIMIPMWVFILPIVTIIPLHRGCQDGNKSELNCEIVDTMWRYLFVHMRSILPLQAILDTLIYAFGSKEFRQALQKLLRKYRAPKH